MLEGYVDAEIDIGVRRQRNTLFCQFAWGVVGCQKEVEAFGVEVYNPSEAEAEGSVGGSRAGREEFAGCNVCTQTEVGPCELSVDAGC